MDAICSRASGGGGCRCCCDGFQLGLQRAGLLVTTRGLGLQGAQDDLVEDSTHVRLAHPQVLGPVHRDDLGLGEGGKAPSGLFGA